MLGRRPVLGLAGLVIFAGAAAVACRPAPGGPSPAGPRAELSRSEILDRIKGGWAGQVIGCTFGGPTEFRFPGAMIADYQPIPWDAGIVARRFERSPGLYDDVYMDLTFLEVMSREGIDAPAARHAQAFARAAYPLWHANQAARYNILHGLLPPDSGHWKNSPHADDIDFQIEADFAGLVSPGLVDAGAEICDRVGHIMNYGDGWYGGVYVAALYSLAFVESGVETVVEKALEVLPPGSGFARCVRDVLACYRADPEDWRAAWLAVERKWAEDVGCPDFVFDPGNIDARVNGAYVVIGLLYGRGDFGRTLEIAARCGQDSDCNPASAGGILGTILGYGAIPARWREPLKAIEDRPFPYTDLSLNEVYETTLRLALDLVRANGGEIEGETVRLPGRGIHPVRYEVSFPGHYPVERRRLGGTLEAPAEIEFEGTGFVLGGGPSKMAAPGSDPYAYEVELALDGGAPSVVVLPVDDLVRRLEIAWGYGLARGRHTLALRLLNPRPGETVGLGDLIVYGDRPAGRS
ncbi:MAG TPA: ADP-ribosylglycohydrolase family protein [Candidatus Aminicenantes bacterium]|nr:ADP-ribosylglycohydrolase family protein [Candidatus Aminicenantes bacterium]HRY65981.1 ADP-ribosylglycohydrolase family protein [Candidatus Aminicenantes bacterium]HRZ72970.1 ADP-ribosylglycohydrolase family protein [Candidatus Aminicenantes bacterium]